ncbi:glycosyl hydrolase family 28-related protein [Kozakia baliensis]|uniref:glycosyl hydrolase family 28-related protein n=1 Tax=Kozakia baliensis TaxID=153496 RepID=UPI00049603BE|nr:glycosyl hydrolase family 28-related protein [Kozakia baliensis]
MKRIIFALALLLPVMSWAQGVPQMDRRVTLAGPTGLNWAMSTKADVNNGSLTNTKIGSATIDSTSTINGTSASLIAQNANCVTTAECILAPVIKYSPNFVGGVARSLLLKLTDTVSVKDFGVVGDGITDDTAAIQAANIGICQGNGKYSGGTIYFPMGSYKITSTVTFPCPGIHWAGQGYGNFYTPSEYNIGGGATIICASGANDCLLWNGGATKNYAAGGTLSEMNINAEAMTTGTVLHTQFMDHFSAHDLHVQSPKQFYFQEAGSNTVLRDININAYRDLNGTHGLIFLDSANDAGCSYSNSDQGSSCRQDRTVLQNVGAGNGETQTGGAVLNIANFVQTVVMTDLNLINGYNAIYASCYQSTDRRACPDFMRLTRVETEQCVHVCLYMNDVSDIWATDSYFNGDDTNGASFSNIYVTCTNFCKGAGNEAWGFWMKGTRINNAKNSCVFIGTPGFVISDNIIFGCNMIAATASNATVGVQVVNQTDVALDKGMGSITGNIIGSSYGQSPTTMDGIYLDRSLHTALSNNNTTWSRYATVGADGTTTSN